MVEEIQLWPEGRVCALTDVHLEAGHSWAWLVAPKSHGSSNEQCLKPLLVDDCSGLC